MESRCSCSFKFNGEVYHSVIEAQSNCKEGIIITKENAISFAMNLYNINQSMWSELIEVKVEPKFD